MIQYLLAIAGGYLIGSATKDKQLFAEGGGVMSNGGFIKDEKLQDLSEDELLDIYEQENGEEFEYDYPSLLDTSTYWDNDNKIKKYYTKDFVTPKEYLFVDLENSFSKEGANFVIYYKYGNSTPDEQRDLGQFDDNDYDKSHIIAAIVAKRMKKGKFAGGGSVEDRFQDNL
jgi:hypothetical protein